ncbi:hypothetical protein MTR72_20095 [Bradyrhizobium sp. ISRA442]|uniref:M10 family metallopeptidase C-terminal domain-containing protein n=1 Tax=Bradyrhizobium sp. ISRA442 TaxID=2866197 RepID=UPI00311ABD80
MGTAKGGLTVAVKFTPQAQNDNLLLQEDDLSDGTQSLSTGSDPNENILANDGGGAAATIMGITSDTVAQVQGNLAHYVDLSNFAAPLPGSSSVSLTGHSTVGDMTGKVLLDATHNINFVLDPANTALLQHLSAGETIDFGQFTYIIRMSNGAFSVAQADIKVAGDNDAAVIVAATNTSGPDNGPFTAVGVTEDAQGDETGSETSIGTLNFTDADWHDSHTASVELSGNLGHLDAIVTTDSQNGATGVISLSYSVADSDINYLGQGETKTETFTVDLVEKHPDGTTTTDTTTVSYTITGTNDAAVVTAGSDMSGVVGHPVSFAGTAGVTENATGDDTTGVETENGTLAFTDADWTDTHSIDPTTGVVAAAGDLGTLTATVATDSGNGAVGEIDLSYSVADSLINYLGQGETKVETFTVNLVEHHPGDNSTTIDPITVTYTITGTDDAAVFASSYDDAGNHTEATVTDAYTSDTTSPVVFTADGTLSFTDADIHDTHTVSIDNTNHLGTLTATVDDSTGTVSWHYSIDDAKIDGVHTSDTFQVVLNDYSITDPLHAHAPVSTTTEYVTIHLDGSLDVAADTGKPTNILFAPDQTGNTGNSLGHFVAVDKDSTDTYAWSLASNSNNQGISIDSAGNLLIAGNASAGTHDLQVTVTDADAPDGTSTTVEFTLLLGTNTPSGDTMPSVPPSTAYVLSPTNNIEAGQNGADGLTGSAGVDYILGGSGNDTIKGLGGADLMAGGNGNDNFVFTALVDSTHSASDTIIDFTHGSDTISFLNGLGLTAVDTTFNSTLAAGHVEFVQNGSNATIYANVGSGSEDATSGAHVMEIHLTNVSGTLSSNDFALHA